VNTASGDERDGSLWTAGDTAAYLRVSVHTVRDWTAAGRLPHIRLGRRNIRYLPDAIRAWARGQAVPEARTDGLLVEAGLVTAADLEAAELASRVRR
jgi:excisionase family DNA binding protein